ncbi:MAG: T9SS type A sorting domain-containing protein, partial [Saprospiraceae bacterium]|nr:T9SS type A sorting domain-containing protein [Saprospiraceae bacterium]
PPDYNFGFGWSVGGDQCAEFNLDIMDPQGDIVDPMETNIMGYFIDCPQYEFSQTQMNLVQSDYFSPGRAYLRTGYTPTQVPVNNEVVYNYPVNGEETPSFQQVQFDWEDTPGATHYLFIIDRFSTFSLEPERYIVEGSSFEIEELEANRTYYWKVWPFNETQTDAGWAETQSFETGTATAVRTIAGVEQFDAYPNPVTDGQLIVSIQLATGVTADIEVVDLAGRVVRMTPDIFIEAGQPWTTQLDVSGLDAGLYVLHVRSSEGILSRKFSIH